MRTLGRREFVAGSSLSQPFGLPAPSDREPFERSDIKYSYEYERIHVYTGRPYERKVSK